MTIPIGYVNRRPNLILGPNLIPVPNLILGLRVGPGTRAGWDPGPEPGGIWDPGRDPGPVGPGPVRTVLNGY